MAKRLLVPHVGITVHLTESVVDRLEVYRQRLQDRLPGLNISTSEAARVALLKGFDSDEDSDDE